MLPVGCQALHVTDEAAVCKPEGPCERLLNPLLLLMPSGESSGTLLARRLCVKGCMAGGQATKGAAPPP